MNRTILSIAAVALAMQVNAAKVTDVTVKALDGFGGDTSSVLTRCQTKPGMEYDPVMLSRDVTSLNASGEFQEIDADAQRTEEGVEIVIYVKRKMRYHAPLAVQGAEFYSESKIAKEAELKDGQLYSEGDFAAAAAKVKALYQKKYFTDVKVTPVPALSAVGNDCTLTFIIDEGKRIKIKDYIFEGAQHADIAELKEALKIYPWWNPIGWFTDEPITPLQLANCVSKIKEYYQNLGYLDVKVDEPERRPSESEGKGYVVFKVEEGILYKVGDTKIEGLTRYPEMVVKEKSDLPKNGDIAGLKALEEAAHRVKVTVGSGDSGLADTRVDIRRIPCEDAEDRLDIVFVVTEGVPVVINEVLIEGNDYTKDKVIRREITLGPGDRMLEDHAERSQKRLENLDYFSRVRYYLRKTDKGKDENGAEYRDLVYEVEEKNTGSFMVGVGASSVDSVYVSAELSQSNFDLFAPSRLFRGGGQKGRVFVQAGPRIQTYEASVTEPHLFDRLLELTVEGYRRQRWYDYYDVIRMGAGASLSYPVKFWPTWDPFGRFGVRLSGEFIEFDDMDDYTYVADSKYKANSYREEDRLYGDAFEPVVRLFWSRDTRDNFRMPTTGSRTSVFVDLAPAGDNKYYRAGFNHRSYFTTWERYRHVLMVNFRLETIDGISDDVPIYNRMFLGGPRSVRGIEYRGVSPYRRRTGGGDDWDPWGGQSLACMNIEYTIPIVKMLRLAAFTDVGGVAKDEWDLSDDFAWTIGLGVRLDIPMFPIRLDFAAPIKKPSHAEREIFSFSIGYDF